MRFPIIVELLGPTGSGKTAVLNAAKAGLSLAGFGLPGGLGERKTEHPSLVYKKKRVLDDLGKRDFVKTCLEIAARNDWLPSQAMSAMNILTTSLTADALNRTRSGTAAIVHDELLLHRAFSFLPRSKTWQEDADRYFSTVPLPSAAVVVTAGAEENIRRLSARGHTNITYGLSEQGLQEVVERSQEIAKLATWHLKRRGLPVLEIDSRLPVEASAKQLIDFVQQVRSSLEAESSTDFLKRQIVAVSGSFHTKGRRHNMRTQGVAYGSFQVSGMTLSPGDAQRNTRQRLTDFGIKQSDIEGCSVLDIGCNTGAVLFELCNLGIASGYGIEIDADKVDVARQVSNCLGLSQLYFDVVNIETLPKGALPVFDLTFALAVEGHVLDKDSFFQLLGDVTQKCLYFEANGGADLVQVKSMLTAQGFDHIEERGVCTDDRDPRNHNRQLLIARKRAVD